MSKSEGLGGGGDVLPSSCSFILSNQCICSKSFQSQLHPKFSLVCCSAKFLRRRQTWADLRLRDGGGGRDIPPLAKSNPPIYIYIYIYIFPIFYASVCPGVWGIVSPLWGGRGEAYVIEHLIFLNLNTKIEFNFKGYY